jgi:hypothetical protein
MKKIFGPKRNKTGVAMDDTTRSLRRAELTAETGGVKASSKTISDTQTSSYGLGNCFTRN